MYVLKKMDTYKFFREPKNEMNKKSMKKKKKKKQKKTRRKRRRNKESIICEHELID